MRFQFIELGASDLTVKFTKEKVTHLSKVKITEGGKKKKDDKGCIQKGVIQCRRKKLGFISCHI